MGRRFDLRAEFARMVYALADTLGHLWATRGPEVYRAAREDRPHHLPVTPEDQEALRSLLEGLRGFPSFEEVILSPEGRAALNGAVLLTVRRSPDPEPLLVLQEEGDSLVWEHTTQRGRFHARYTLAPEIEFRMEVRRSQEVAIALEARFSLRGLVYWSLDHGLEAPARPRHWAFLWEFLRDAAVDSALLRELFDSALPLMEGRFSQGLVKGELEEAALAFRAAAVGVPEAAPALEELDALGIGIPRTASVGLPEATSRLLEAIRDAEELLGANLAGLRLAAEGVLKG